MTTVLERGDIFFVHRPRVQSRELDEDQRFYMILHPRDRELYRRIVVGRAEDGAHERYWAFVDRVAREPKPVIDDLHYTSRTRELAVVAQPAGEGVYEIVEHEDHRHFAYRLEMPPRVGTVQHELRIAPETNYVIAVRNPDTGSGLAAADKPAYPAELRAHFEGRRVAPLDPAFLDHVGTELVLVASSRGVMAELGIELDPEREAIGSAEIFTDLALDRRAHPIAPLITVDRI